MSAIYPVFGVYSEEVNKKTNEIGVASCKTAAESIFKKKMEKNAYMILEEVPATAKKEFQGKGFAWFLKAERR